MNLMGSAVIARTASGSSESGSLRSMTSVAPKDLRKVSFCFEATVIMGEKPESLANWIAVYNRRLNDCVYKGMRKAHQFDLRRNCRRIRL